MSIIVVGGGEIGVNFVELAVNDGIDVVVIEPDSERANYILTTYNCEVINDKPASMTVLRSTMEEWTDALVACSESDSINITSCLMGQELGIEKTAAIVNDPDNAQLFQDFNIKTVESPSRLIAERFYTLATHSSIINRQRVWDTMEIIEIRVDEEAPISGCTISEAATSGYLGDDVLVIAVHQASSERDKSIPRGSTRIAADDHVTLLAPSDALGDVTEAFENRVRDA